jgi:hypothetical protein
MVFPYAEEMQTESIGQDGFLNDVPQHDRLRKRLSPRVERDVAECVDAEFDAVVHSDKRISQLVRDSSRDQDWTQ